ncbi:MAG: hypothetical protein KDI68_05785, partial [Gammaproteobacteria bacterium]|nr:hypothetical protein [Gammaproteobacteria bacterium]
RRIRLLFRHGFRALVNDMRRLPHLQLHLRTAPSVDGLFSFDLPLERCRTIIQQRYDDRDNVFVACARQLLAGDRAAAEKLLHDYYAGFQPASLYDCFHHSRQVEPLGEVRSRQHPTSLIIPPWDAMRRRDRARIERKSTVHPMIGPQTEATIKRHLERYQAVCDSIRVNGYQPQLFGHIQGHVLDSGDDAVFVVTSGKHRMAVLAALGVDSVPVTFKRNMPRLFSRSQSRYWPNVVSGFYAEAEAEAVFDGFFVTAESSA